MSLLSFLEKPYYVVSALMVIILMTILIINTATTNTTLINKTEINGAVSDEPLIAGSSGGPVVLELFTSQGCSSCPPADAFLQEIASNPQWRDRVIPLAFHVDYWNYLGWKDPFSKSAWTERQGSYVTAMGGATMYTPQLVIHGREETVGVRYNEIRNHIERLSALPEAHALEIVFASLQREDEAVKGEVWVEGALPAGKGTIRLLGILFERGRDTAVRRGENAGKTLKNDYIVRNMVDLGQLQRASKQKEINREAFALHMPVDHALASSRYGVVVLAQDASSMKMLGAAVKML